MIIASYVLVVLIVASFAIDLSYITKSSLRGKLKLVSTSATDIVETHKEKPVLNYFISRYLGIIACVAFIVYIIVYQ